METYINLCKILKGHVGEMFYSPVFGNIKLELVTETFLYFGDNYHNIITINDDGKYIKNADELAVYPSKHQKDWIKWANKKWVPEDGDTVYIIDELFSIRCELYKIKSVRHRNLFELGNIFQTQGEAEEAAEVLERTLQEINLR